MLCWRRLRPGWVLAVAGLIFGGLAISQNSGVQIYPDWWGALGVLALTGLVLHAVNGTMRDRVTLPSIAFASLLIVLMRPQNIVFIMGPAILAVIIVRAWRRPKVLLAMGIGIALGCLEWVIGAYLWYGGLGSRIHLAGQEPPSFGLYFSLGHAGEGAQRAVVLHPANWLPGLGDARRVRLVGGLPCRRRPRASAWPGVRLPRRRRC